MTTDYYRKQSQLIPEPDRQTLIDFYETQPEQNCCESVSAEKFVGMIAERIYTEISRGIHGYIRGITDDDTQRAYVRWVDYEVHLAQEKIPVSVDTHEKYSDVRRMIVREIGAWAADLFNRWEGTSAPYPYGDHDNLRSTLWNKLPPEVPKGASSVRIITRSREQAEEMMRQITQKTGKGGAQNEAVVTVEFSGEQFKDVWKICKEYRIFYYSLIF